MIEITLPYPPTVNHFKRTGRILTTKSGKQYQPRVNTDATKRFYYEVWMLVRQSGLEGLGEATISLELDIYPPDKRKRDIDNVIKPTVDSLMRSGLFDDDSQIARLLVTRKVMISQGQIIVRIKPL